MEIQTIGFDDFQLLLRGWRDAGSRLRIAFKSSALEFFAFCTLIDVRDNLAAFWDVPPADARLPLGVEQESAIEAVRNDFALLIMLLK